MVIVAAVDKKQHINALSQLVHLVSDSEKRQINQADSINEVTDLIHTVVH